MTMQLLSSNNIYAAQPDRMAIDPTNRRPYDSKDLLSRLLAAYKTVTWAGESNDSMNNRTLCKSPSVDRQRN